MSTLQVSAEAITLSAQDEIRAITGSNASVINTTGLSDVSSTSPTDNQVLRYNSTLNVYVPETLSSAGDTALQPGDNISVLTNNSGYITASSSDTLTNKSGNVSQFTNDSGYTTASSTETLTNKSGNISMFTNDASYLTSETITLTQLKTVVAASTDFADFQSRVAAL